MRPTLSRNSCASVSSQSGNALAITGYKFSPTVDPRNGLRHSFAEAASEALPIPNAKSSSLRSSSCTKSQTRRKGDGLPTPQDRAIANNNHQMCRIKRALALHGPCQVHELQPWTQQRLGRGVGQSPACSPFIVASLCPQKRWTTNFAEDAPRGAGIGT